MLDFQTIQERVSDSLQNFNTSDHHLLNVQAHERSLTFRLGYFLQHAFPDHHVDCEYNRDEYRSKRVYESLRCPDIIVHLRGTNDHNLLAIEAKCNWGRGVEGEDERRIADLVAELRYKAGLVLVFNQDGKHRELWHNGEDFVGHIAEP